MPDKAGVVAMLSASFLSSFGTALTTIAVVIVAIGVVGFVVCALSIHLNNRWVRDEEDRRLYYTERNKRLPR